MASAQGGDATGKKRPRLFIGMFSDIWDPRLALPLSTAYRFGLRPVVLGLGSAVSWGAGLGNAWNAYRDYAMQQTDPDDLMLFIDAHDVMFQAGEDELVDAYLRHEARTGRQLVYNADPFCSSPRLSEYPESSSPWKYLNSGVYMGRVRTLQRLFANQQVPKLSARLQNIHTDFFLDHQDVAALDYRCEIAQVVFNVPGFSTDEQRAFIPGGLPPEALRLAFEGGRVRNLHTNTTPLILHFPGPGHWPLAADDSRTGTCLAYELLRQSQPGMLRLMEEQSEVRKGGGKYFGLRPWKPICTYYVSPFDYLGYRVAQWGDVLIWWYFHRFPQLVSMVAVSLACTCCCICGGRRSRVDHSVAGWLPSSAVGSTGKKL